MRPLLRFPAFVVWLVFAASFSCLAVEPVKIAVGYQPWYAETTTAIVIRDFQLWKKFTFAWRSRLS